MRSGMMTFTGEYSGGLLAGLGLGIELCGYFVVGEPFLKTEWHLAGFILIGVGTFIAKRAQDRSAELSAT